MLNDHFHPPLFDRRDWHGFHTQWCSVLAADLNARLPKGWWAQPEAIFGFEVDVGVVEDQEADSEASNPENDLATWQPGEPTATLAYAIDEDSVEIRVINSGYGPELMGAIELVSPSNKDRPQAREAFVSKCVAILNRGAGLIVVDVVTSRQANLHMAILERLGQTARHTETNLYASAFHLATDASDQQQVRIWEEGLAVDHPLPTLPLFLRVGPMMAVDLQKTYQETCRQLRIPTADTISS